MNMYEIMEYYWNNSSDNLRVINYVYRTIFLIVLMPEFVS